MQALVPLALLFLSVWSADDERVTIPSTPISMACTGTLEEDSEYHENASRKGASVRSTRSYAADHQELMTLSATVTEFSGMKFTRDRLRFSFATTVWMYEIDKSETSEILEEKETNFGPYPAFYLRMKVVPKDEPAYLFEAYAIAVNDKEVFVSASYADDPEARAAVDLWSASLRANEFGKGDLRAIVD